ncbi:serine hydrolase domain-containing protein [Shewanella glacialimarina]|uniref:serine hydrolase domain-containing protein n=1 Tax=Shewanella glacialimarina TaxID=2590884 RepID=UPI001CF864C0|nr:serine hydrolase domain-containing protein [Shewanella glacialimarina]UCX06010.1 beta-lactamase family protein [Shewanella glacialimarina]
MNLRAVATILFSVLLLLSGYSYSNTSLLQGDNLSKDASIKTVPKPQDINILIQAAINDSLQPFSGSVMLIENGIPLLELQKGEGIHQASSFVMASLSKQITATLVLQAVDAGKLGLNHSLNRYLFDHVTLDKRKLQHGIETNSDKSASSFLPNQYDERITIHHLLSHTSGVDELGKPNRFEPGSQFEYSNFGYALLGQLLEKVNQQSFAMQIAQFSQVNKLNGLYAQVGSIETIRQNLASLAIGLNESDVIAPANLVIDASLLPAGGLIASAAAFAEFQHQLHSGKLISPKSYDLMTRSHTRIKFLWPNMSYGYGLRINTEDGITEYSHTGYLPGYMSMSLHYPEFNFDLVMLENLSLNLNDLSRVFELHTQIRQAIRSNLLLTKKSHLM